MLYYGARGGEACGVWGYILYASAWNLVVPESVCGCGVCREFHTVMVLSWGECAEQEREEWLREWWCKKYYEIKKQ